MDIQVSTGTREFNLGGKVIIYFNPTDVTFLDRMRNTFAEMQKQQEEIANEISNADDVFEACKRIDADMREKLNSIFAKDIVTPLIGDMNVYALADGLPIWANILTAIMKTIEDCVEEERSKSEAKIKEYTEKYD